MLCRLKITIHDIKVRSPIIPKAPPDHDLHILTRTIGLDHFWLPFLSWSAEGPLISFILPLLHRALIALHCYALLLWHRMPIFLAPGKPSCCILWGKEWALFAFPIL